MLRGGTNKQCASIYTGAYELADCERYVNVYNHGSPPSKSSLKYWREIAICYNGGPGRLSQYIAYGHTKDTVIKYANDLIDVVKNLPNDVGKYIKKMKEHT